LKKLAIYIVLLILLLSCSKKEVNPTYKNSYILNESFEKIPFSSIPKWITDPNINTGPYTESGEYYQQQKIFPPNALRNSIPLGENNWLTAEIYTRTKEPIIIDYLDII
jgi:hypothetical protein